MRYSQNFCSLHVIPARLPGFMLAPRYLCAVLKNSARSTLNIPNRFLSSVSLSVNLLDCGNNNIRYYYLGGKSFEEIHEGCSDDHGWFFTLCIGLNCSSHSK